MKRLLRWVGIGLGTLGLLAALAWCAAYVVSERKLRRRYAVQPEPRPLTLPSDSVSLAEGRRLAIVRGCPGCHGDALEGGVLFDDPLIARLVAPNLVAAARTYTDEELARIIRRGVRPNGRSVVAMPSEMFRELSDEDLVRILAYVRSMPDTAGLGPEVRVRLLGRVGLATGQYKTTVEYVTEGGADPTPVTAPTDSLALGRYLARTICSECHGMDLGGDSANAVPSLAVAAGYPDAEFDRLLTTGVPLDGRQLGLMAEVARGRFVHLTPDERRALHAYLKTLPGS